MLAPIAIVGALTSCYAAREPLLTKAAFALTADNAEGPADYLVVLGGNPEDRPFAAADLFHRGVAPTVVVFEYSPSLGGAPSQTELSERILTLQGVPLERVERAPGRVRNTWEEARSLRRLLQGKAVTRVVIVTSAEHTRRAGWAFERALADLSIEVRTAAARREDFDERNWWRTDEGVLLYIHELLKLPYYWVRYRYGGLE